MPLLSPGLARHSSTFTGSETAANLNSANAKTVTVKAKWKSNCNDGISSVGGSKTFSYTGSVQSFNACAGRTYKLEVWGAQGGDGGANSNVYLYGAQGGYATGTKNINQDTTLYIVVGGRPSRNETTNTATPGGYNGGGQGWTGSDSRPGGAGGGATHIATRTGVLSSLSSYKSDILIVAGGGGGNNAGCDSTKANTAGTGGGVSGGNASSERNTQCGKYGTGGTQTGGGGCQVYDASWGNYGASGSFGQGGSMYSHNSSWSGSGGGGGYYGGGGCSLAAGGGGSGYIGGVSGGSMTNGQRSGNGQAKITRQS